MDTKEVSYENPEHLNYLVRIIEGKNCELSATLKPNIPEFIEATRKFSISYRPEISGIKTILDVCSKHKIKPLWKLVFDKTFGSNNKLKIEYVGPKYSGINPRTPNDEKYEKIFQECSHPLQLIRNDLWYSIFFREFKGEKIKRVQESISEFIRNGYLVT